MAQALALTAVLVTSGVVAGTASASRTRVATAQAVTASLTYRCLFPSGPRPVPVAVTATLPVTGHTGRPIRPSGAGLTVTLPQAAVASLASLHSTTVRATTWLTVGASEGPVATSVVWPGTTRGAAPIPAHGSMTLRTSGRAPSVTPSTPGTVVLAAAGLSMWLAPGSALTTTPRASSSPASTGTNHAVPTPPTTSGPTVRVTCTLGMSQRATLASVLVTGSAARRSRSAVAPKCPKLPPGGLLLNPRWPLPKFPPGSNVGSSPAAACAYTTGYADARKLKGAALIPPGLTNVDLTVRTVTNFSPSVNYLEFDNAAQLYYHGLHEFPPTTATFLTFGFVPTTATILLVEHGTINIIAVGPANPGQTCTVTRYRTCDNIATVYSRLSVQIVPGSVKVNGVPLDVGSHCETPPFDAILRGSSATTPPYNVQLGGPLQGFVNIPQFRNCGVGQNLAPIFNAAISGPKNFNLLTQGAPCFVIGAFGCDPKTGQPLPPKPLRKISG